MANRPARPLASILGCLACAACALATMTAVPPARAGHVWITEKTPYVEVRLGGKVWRIRRAQGLNNRLSGELTQTSRPCPPACIQPIRVAPGVSLAGELEVLRFMQAKAATGSGLLLDSRSPQDFTRGSLPGALNLPPRRLAAPGAESLLQQLGGRRKRDGTWDFSRGKALMIFGRGPADPLAAATIRALIRMGYPAGKLHHYRGGVRNWAVLGLPLSSQ